MSEIDSKLCKICLNSNTDTGLSVNPSLNKFFSHILGIQKPPLSLWLCIWCKSVLRNTAKLMQLAEESQRILSNVKMSLASISCHKQCKSNLILATPKISSESSNVHQIKYWQQFHLQTKTTNNNYNKENEIKNVFTLSYHHNDHYDIPPDEKHKHKKTKTLKPKIKEIHFVNLEEKDVTKVKDENKAEDIDNVVKVEIDLDIDDTNDDANDDFNDHEEDKIEKPKRKVNPKLYVKCEENNFTLKVLSFEEQVEELEAKKRTEKYLGRKYKCEFCGVGFVTKDVFEEHKKRHAESYSPHECPICRLRFSTSLVLSQHLLAHERRFTCKLCEAVITRYADCENHRLKCGQATPGVCLHCKKIFSNQNSLEQHIRGVHYKREKKFVCSFCNQRFQSKQRLAIHTRTHTGAKPYTCDLCHRSFAANSNLRNHLSAHAHVRPHYCVECDKSYKTRKGLRRHLLEGATHKGKGHSCHYCLKNFTTEKLLASHIAASHTKETEHCDPCNKSFSTCGNLKNHMESVHESPVS